MVKNPLRILQSRRQMWVLSLGQEAPLEEEMATHSRLLAWRIPRTGELSRLHTVHGVGGVGHG